VDVIEDTVAKSQVDPIHLRQVCSGEVKARPIWTVGGPLTPSPQSHRWPASLSRISFADRKTRPPARYRFLSQGEAQRKSTKIDTSYDSPKRALTHATSHETRSQKLQIRRTNALPTVSQGL
jgi:hypothetical protein